MGNEEKFYDSRGTQALPKAAHEHRMQLERLGANDPYELRAVIAEQRARIDAYEAGHDATPREESTTPATPGQLWHRLLNAPEDLRLAMLLAALENARTAHDCFMQDHKGLGNQLEEERELLSIAVFGSPTLDRTRQLHTAVRALRQVMVDGIAARSTVLEPVADGLDDFPEEPDVREKIGAQLKSAGIDLQSICGYEWGKAPEAADGSICYEHECGTVNPLHVDSHECASCGAVLSQVEAEQLAEAGQ